MSINPAGGNAAEEIKGKPAAKIGFAALGKEDKIRVAIGAALAVAAAALSAFLCTDKTINKSYRWLVYLPVAGAIVTPGQVSFSDPLG